MLGRVASPDLSTRDGRVRRENGAVDDPCTVSDGTESALHAQRVGRSASRKRGVSAILMR